MSKMSRRNFIAGVGAGLAAVASASAGAAFAAGVDVSNEVAGADYSWDEEYDVVVVGAGLAGMTAAVATANKGGASCLLIEKTDDELGGGNSHYSGGSVIYTDAEYKADALKYWKGLREDYTTTPDDVLEVFIDYMSTMVDFMREIGAKDEDFTLYEPGQAHMLSAAASDNDSDEAKYSSGSIISCWPEYPELEGSTAVGRMIFSGSEMSTFSIFMHSKVTENSDAITYKLNAALTGLVQDESGAVVGAVYDDNGTPTRVKANKGVIMCCGGFERNAEMLQDYLSMPNAYHIAGSGNTGDGHLICAKLGAKFWHMNSMAGTWNGAVTVDQSQHAMWFTTGRQYGITVGTNGRRYYMDVDYVVSNSWWDYLQGDADIRTTCACRHGHYNFGGEWPHMVLPKNSFFIFDSDNVENAVRGGIMRLCEGDPVEEGWAVRADTIEELAELIDVPADELATTVETWNESCEKGVDVQFYRSPDWQTPVKAAPFYAIRMQPEFINTDGGPVRTAKGEILDLDGNVIPGLYSAGEFGSVWCDMYQGGGNLSECVNFARICVDSILG